MSIDAFYTPKELAFELVKQAENTPKIIGDFCAGDGELLRAAQERWPQTACVATDLDTFAIEKIYRQHPNWEVAVCDFLDPISRCECRVLKNHKKEFDLVLLNPPFSCRGATRHTVSVDKIMFKASTAMAFIVEAIQYIKKNGCIFAVLPCSVAYSEKDEELWAYLVKKYHLKIIAESKEIKFKHCRPNIILVSINTLNSHENPTSTHIIHGLKRIEVFRGKISMDTLRKRTGESCYLVHSTNLQDNKLVSLNHMIDAKSSEVTGPAVLIPRVGTPNPQKIVVLSALQTVVLSDCVIALKVDQEQHAVILRNALINDWKIFSRLYKGTGARYITLKKINKILGIN